MGLRTRAFCAALLGVLVSVAIAAGGLTSASAAEGGGSETPAVGGFGVGDATEAMIDERDGSVRLSVPVADLELTWDSRAVAAGDQTGFGPGWGVGLTRIGVHGGVTVTLPSGGVHEADDTQSSGLAGYGVGDLRFEVTPGGVLEGRADGAAGEIAYAYTLAELGGTVTYFDDDGRPVARIGARGLRADWRWEGESGQAARLRTSVSADGVVTELDWRDPGAVLVHQAANLPPADDGLDRIWRVQLDGGRVERLVDPAGGGFAVGYTREGLVSRASAASGARTELTWRAYDDRVTRIDTIRTVDLAGAELSVRHWRPVGAALPSGWPEHGGDRELFFSRDAAFRYVTEVSDGATSVRSTYRSLHTMETRDLRVSGASGEQVLRRHAYTYPTADGGELPDPRALPGNWSRPAEAELTYLDAGGADRSVRTEYEIDDFGRTVRESDVDGTVTETEYAPGEPGESGATRPPIGLAVRERVTGPDGSIAETRRTLDAAGSAVVATETLAGDDPEALTVTSRTEFTVEADGFVSEQREYSSGDPAATPVITRWQRSTDLSAGDRTVTETVAAGTESEATTATTVSLAHGGAVASVDAAGHEQTAEYDVLGQVTTQTDAAGRATVSAYERHQADGRNAVVVTTPDGVTRTEQHDALGRVERITDDLANGVPTPGHERLVEQRAYPDAATVVVTDAWGASTTARQDVFGRAIETRAANGAVTRTDYDDVANTVTTRVTPTGDPADAETVTVQRLDAAGRDVETTGTRADGVAVPRSTTDYDGLGRVLATDDGTRRSRVEYDAFGNAVRTSMAASVAEIEGADAAGAGADAVDAAAQAAEADASGATGATAETLTERRFDGFGASLEMTLTSGDDAATAGSRELDELGRARTEVDPLGRTTRHTYTRDGLLERTEAGSGQVTDHTYDPETRQLTGTVTTSPIGEEVRVAIERDERTDLPVAVFDPADREGTEIRTRYDGFGNPVEVAYPGGRVMTIAYDEHGRRVRTTDVSGRATFLDYDESGRILRAVQRETEREDSPTVAEVAYRYDGLGRVHELERGNGVVTEYTFTSASEIATETTTRGGDVLSAREYSYQPNGLLERRVDRVRDEATGELDVTATSYEYDAFSRLVRSTSYDGDASDAPETARAEYDPTVGGDVRSERVWAAADPLSADAEFGGAAPADAGPADAAPTDLRPVDAGPADAGPADVEPAEAEPADAEPADAEPADATGRPDEPVTRTFEYSPLGELAAVTTDGERVAQEYDAAGNLVRAADGTEYRYDAANRVVAELRDGQRTDTQYWADGSRRGRSSDAGAVTFYWDGDTLLTEEHHDAASVTGTASYVIGAGRHARVVVPSRGATETAYYATDRHGNVTELTDGSGAVTTRYAYSDYGLVNARGDETESDPLRRNPFRYAGAYTHTDGTQWLRVRTYDPVSMRFTTMDEADLLNGYNFADLNPIMMVDPSGRAPQYDTAVDLVVLTAATAFAFSMAVAAIFTGGWSLTMLGIVGWVADAVTIGTSVYRLDAAARGKVIDPEVETALFATEIAFAAVGAAALVHTVKTVPRALELQSTASKLKFTPVEHIGAYPAPKKVTDRWVYAHDGDIDSDLRRAIEKRFKDARTQIDRTIASQNGRMGETKELIKDSWSISEAARGGWLTKPLLAAVTERRIGEQVRRVAGNQSTLAGYSRRWISEALESGARKRSLSSSPRIDDVPSSPGAAGDELWFPPSEIRSPDPIRLTGSAPPSVRKYN